MNSIRARIIFEHIRIFTLKTFMKENVLTELSALNEIKIIFLVYDTCQKVPIINESNEHFDLHWKTKIQRLNEPGMYRQRRPSSYIP